MTGRMRAVGANVKRLAMALRSKRRTRKKATRTGYTGCFGPRRHNSVGSSPSVAADHGGVPTMARNQCGRPRRRIALQAASGSCMETIERAARILAGGAASGGCRQPTERDRTIYADRTAQIAAFNGDIARSVSAFCKACRSLLSKDLQGFGRGGDAQ